MQNNCQLMQNNCQLIQNNCQLIYNSNFLLPNETLNEMLNFTNILSIDVCISHIEFYNQLESCLQYFNENNSDLYVQIFCVSKYFEKISKTFNNVIVIPNVKIDYISFNDKISYIFFNNLYYRFHQNNLLLHFTENIFYSNFTNILDSFQFPILHKNAIEVYMVELLNNARNNIFIYQHDIKTEFLDRLSNVNSIFVFIITNTNNIPNNIYKKLKNDNIHIFSMPNYNINHNILFFDQKYCIQYEGHLGIFSENELDVYNFSQNFVFSLLDYNFEDDTFNENGISFDEDLLIHLLQSDNFTVYKNTNAYKKFNLLKKIKNKNI